MRSAVSAEPGIAAMQRLTYRAARAADLPFIISLAAEDDVSGSIEPWQPKSAPAYEAVLAEIDADPHEELFLAELDGVPVGTFQLTYLSSLTRPGMRRGLVESVHIVPGRRNNGFGSEMMRWAIERCRAQGCGIVQLTSNKQRIDAHRFYETLGFSRTHEGFRLFL
jgi:GNAT superfamily N-acetyltransferase